MPETALALTDENVRSISEGAMTVFDKFDPMEFVEKIGKVYGMTGAGGCKTENDGKLMALACLVKKKHIFDMAEEYHLMDGKLAIKSDEALTRFQAHGGKSRWIKDGTDRQEAILELVGWDGITINSRFTLEMAEAAGLVKEKSNWIKWTPAMLRSRCITEGIRMQWPGILKGHSSVDEVADYIDSTAIVKSSVPSNGRSTTKTIAKTVIEPEKVIDAESSPVVQKSVMPTIEVEKPPFDVGKSTSELVDRSAQTIGDADESNLPSAADSFFTAVVLEIQSLIPQCGWNEPDILKMFNGKFGTDHADFGGFDPEQQEKILTNIRTVHKKHQEKLSAEK